MVAACVAVITRVHGSGRGVWILFASLAFLAVYALISVWFRQLGLLIPGGVVAATAVTFVPVGASAVERLIGVWRMPTGPGPFQEFEGPDFVLALVTLAAGLLVYSLVRFPFVFVYVAGGTLVAAHLLVPVFVSRPTPADHATALIVIGVGLLAVGGALDLRGERRAAFWWHLDGLVTMSIGLAYHAFSHASWGWLLILVVGALVLLAASPLRRATWGLFGVFGTYAPVVHYTDKWFGNLGTAFALAAVGFGLIWLGAAWQTGGEAWRRRFPSDLI